MLYRSFLLVIYFTHSTEGFPGGSHGKESTCNAGYLGLILGLGRSPRGGQDNPLQYSCVENPHGQRSLVGYSPRGRKELDRTRQLSTSQHSTKSMVLPSKCSFLYSGQFLKLYLLCFFSSKISQVIYTQCLNFVFSLF